MFKLREFIKKLMKYIDLGLSVLWTDCNIGANTHEEFGNYYKWDEIPKDYEIPTIEQYKELITNCNWWWTTQNGVSGYKVMSDEGFRRYVNGDCDVCGIPDCNIDLMTIYKNYFRNKLNMIILKN